MRACVRACACVRTCVSVRVFAYVCACVCVCVGGGGVVCVCSERVCAPRRCARTLVPRRRLAVFIARPATRLSGSHALAAGAMWRCRTASAPWAGRSGHTSVIDAAGAIYVIGGYSYNGTNTYFNDVWVSTDAGARPDSVRAWPGGYWVGTQGNTGGYSRGSLGIPRGLETGRPTHERISDLHPCCSPSVAAHVNGAPDAIILHGWPACLSARTVCLLIGVVARARVSADAF
jgi:hypothetical protein